MELNKRRELNGKRTDGIQVMRKLVKVIQGKDEEGKMWLESVVNENMEKDLVGSMSQNWDKCEGIPQSTQSWNDLVAIVEGHLTSQWVLHI